MRYPIGIGIAGFIAMATPAIVAAPAADLSRELVVEQARDACGGSVELAPDAILETDIDGDGAADYLLNWGGVSCTIGPGAKLGRGGGNCGMQNCVIDVYASSVFDPNSLPQQILAAELEPTPAGDPVALRTWYMDSNCGFAEVCQAEWVWTGTALEAQE